MILPSQTQAPVKQIQTTTTPTTVSTPAKTAPPKKAKTTQSVVQKGAVAKSATVVNPKAIALNNQGVEKVAKADYKGALQDFNQAIKLSPKFPEAYVGRGIVYSVQGKRATAIQEFTRAIKLNPKFAEAYLYRADDYLQLSNRKLAIADLKQAQTLFTQQGNTANAQQAKDRMELVLAPPLPPLEIPEVRSPQLATGTTLSAEMALAMHLRKMGAKMYGTYWCPSCQWQQQEFGSAFSQINYIECDPAGANARPDLCDRAGIQSYPTWEFNGQLYRPGSYSLDALADISGYQGARNFGG
jgi:tetratricopeptide (TPR) repeat protein